MCSKNATDSSSSIATRLTVLYTVSMLAILVSMIGFMLHTMVSDLEYEDNDFLVERISSIRAMISLYPHDFAHLKEHLLPRDADRHVRYLVRIQDAAGATLIESSAMGSLPSLLFPPPLLDDQPLPMARKHRADDGRSYLLNSAWAEAAGDRRFRLVQVALDVSEEEALMANYRLKMGIAFLAGLCLAGGLALIISRRELRPLRAMAGQIAQITASDLHQRVGSRRWPKEFAPLTAALDTMLGQLEQSFERLTAFSANLAHELRTPLNNLRVESEVALSRPRSAAEYRQTIESSVEEYERLSRMIGDILFLARPEQGVELQPLDARIELDRLADYYRTLADERDISLSVDGTGTIAADPRLFQRAVGNLLANALHYTPNGGAVPVSIQSDAAGAATIVVKDNGPGIPDDELPLVFDRFYRSAQARQLHRDGSGLGLAIVRSIMELHGGSVTLTSQPGHGTSVTLHFPQS
jgi:two-component system heavy metal sensor histidine kinase CusS